MHTFRDNHSRVWSIVINVAAVKRCRGLLGIDLFGLVNDKFEGLGKLLSDPCDLVDVLYVLCKDEADKLKMTDEDFGRSMGGDSLQLAAEAFLQELTDFFPDPRIRAGLQKIWDKSRTLGGILLEEFHRTIDGVDPASEAKRLIASSGKPQEP